MWAWEVETGLSRATPRCRIPTSHSPGLCLQSETKLLCFCIEQAWILNQNAESLVKENSGLVSSHQSFPTVFLLRSLCSDVQKSDAGKGGWKTASQVLLWLWNHSLFFHLFLPLCDDHYYVFFLHLSNRIVEQVFCHLLLFLCTF